MSKGCLDDVVQDAGREQESEDESEENEEEVERQQEAAVKILSQQLRSTMNSKTFDHYLGITASSPQDRIPTNNSSTTLNVAKRSSPSSPPQRSFSDGPSKEKRSRAEMISDYLTLQEHLAIPAAPSPISNNNSVGGGSNSTSSLSGSGSGSLPLIKKQGRGRGRMTFKIDHNRQYVSQVFELAQAMGWPLPVFDHSRVGRPPVELWKVTLRLERNEFEASLATTKIQQGKELACLEALQCLLGALEV